MKVHLEMRIRSTPEVKSADVDMVALPTKGDYVEHEPSGILGTVDYCSFLWDEFQQSYVIVHLE